MNRKPRLPEVGAKPDAATEALRSKMMGDTCPRCGKTALQPDAVHTCSPKALVLADKLQQQAVWEGHYGPSYLRDLLPEAAAELRRLHQSEREGWRYADEVEHERKQLQVMLHQERTEYEALLRQALECLTYRAPYEDCIDAMDEYERMSEATITALRARLNHSEKS